MLWASMASAQTCNIPDVAVGGYYSFTALGTGSSASTTTGTTGTSGTSGTGSSTSGYSNTEIGMLLGGIANPSSPFASVGTLYFDGAGNILGMSTAQQSGANQTTLAVGTYVLNANCTITVNLTDAFGTNSAMKTLQGVVINGGSEIDLSLLQSSGTGTGSTSTGPSGSFETTLLVKLVRPAAQTCAANQLMGAYALTGTAATKAGSSSTTGTSGTSAETPLFFFGLVQFDGNGNVITPVSSSSASSSSGSSPNGTPASSGLGYLQFTGTYTINPDCSGTLTLTPSPNGLALGATSTSTSGTGTSETGTSGTGTTGTGTTGTGTSTSTTLTLDFVLSRASFIPAQGTAAPRFGVPEIEFVGSNATQTISGLGVAQ